MSGRPLGSVEAERDQPVARSFDEDARVATTAGFVAANL
jgi:hypothetical protein